MTVAPEIGAEARCLQLFTWRYDEFTFGNDTVTTPDLDGRPLQASHSKRYQPPGKKLLVIAARDAVAAAVGIKI